MHKNILSKDYQLVVLKDKLEGDKMKFRRLFSAVLDLLIISTVYYTLLGLLFNIGLYAPFIASCIELPVIYYIFGVNRSPGKIIFMLHNSKDDLDTIQKLKMYPVTMLVLMQLIINATYPFFVFTLGYTGIMIIVSLYVGLLILLMICLICVFINKDFWNRRFNNKIIKIIEGEVYE